MKQLPLLHTDIVVTSRSTPAGEVYTVQDVATDEKFEFGEEEYFLLTQLNGKNSPDAIIRNMKQRFGVDMSEDDLADFLGDLEDWGLLASQDEPQVSRRSDAGTPSAPALLPEDYEDYADAGLAELGVEDGLGGPVPGVATPDLEVGASPRKAKTTRYWKFFNPTRPFGILGSVFSSLRYLVYLLPIFVLIAGATLFFNPVYFSRDFQQLWQPLTLFQHVLFGLVTVNLIARVTEGVVAVRVGASAPGFGLTLAGFVLPRFHTELGDLETLPRRKRLWLYASPMLARVSLFAGGVIAWHMTRGTGTALPLLSFTLGLIALASFLLSGNPLGGGEGYRFLSDYLGMPRMRGFSFVVLFKRLLPEEQRKRLTGRREAGLKVYAFAALIYILVLAGVVLFFSGRWLEIRYEGTGVVILLGLITFVSVQIIKNIKRFRSINFPEREFAPAAERYVRQYKGNRNTARKVTWLLLLVILVFVGFLPYPYETGGAFELIAARSQEIYAEKADNIQNVFFEGGEWLKKGTVIAEMDSYEQKKNVATTGAQILEKEAELNRLLSTPRPDEVELSEKQLAAARIQAEHSSAQAVRFEKLYADGNVSVEDYEASKMRAEVDEQEVLEMEAKLELVKEGPHPEEITAARAELQRLKEQLAYYEEQLRRSRLVMPFEGRLATPRLQYLVGKFLDKDDLFTVVNDDRGLKAIIDVPETDIGEFSLGRTVRLKLWAFPDELVYGDVTYIEPVAIEQSFGRVVQVTADVPNEKGRLRPGMTGYAKIDGGTKPVAVAFSRRIVRFFLVELWSWIP